MLPKRYYYTPDGVEYPLHEAPYKYVITVHKSDCKKAIIGDPTACLIALGAKRDPAVLSAHIGSGKDAYLVFKTTKLRKAYALHFTVKVKAARVRDYFDTHKKAETTNIELSVPTAGRTLAHRSKLNKARNERIKNGTHTVKSRGSNQTRIVRIGVKHRPRAVIEKNVVSMPLPEAVA